ncbi:branched-chain amino acid ABC transporter permease [Protaetiibacter mangrovi]|uniref:Branched-chain amino acid ABC transporter permease n=1 Tax=Protaetiibacter mangrovi TaxID=2970926 RepID=A0ABT1ZFT4_9MICO|nr:branched-chain amino acid ABC transporter permease [Protaetiibacter mangrovi]MCS0499550.1 branched-chain amino acid ABC transporter permease [Protaetiibacter mangrovi]TPX04570.1 branched-chain amino acid ABC transporter permease [Schumannella luteola]
MSTVLLLLGAGLARGAVFALFALALVLIWRATRIANFAQGAMAVTAAYVAYLVLIGTGSFPLAVVVVLLAGAGIGVGVERGLMRYLPTASPLNAIIVAIGVVMVLTGLLGILFGADYKPISVPFSREPITVGSLAIVSPYTLFVFVVIAVVVAGIGLLFTRTSLGLAMRASAFDEEVARLNGVRVVRMRTLGWMLSSAVGGLAVLLAVPTELGLNPHSGDLLFVNAFTVAIIGGLDSPVGAVVAGLGVGVLLTIVTTLWGATVGPIAILLLLVLVLLLRPQGLFSLRKARLA